MTFKHKSSTYSLLWTFLKCPSFIFIQTTPSLEYTSHLRTTATLPNLKSLDDCWYLGIPKHETTTVEEKSAISFKSTACPLCQFHFKRKKHMAFVRSRARAEERQITAHDWQIPQVKMLNLWATSFRKFSKLCQTLPSCVDFCWQVVFLFFCPQSVLFSLLDYETSIIVLKKPAFGYNIAKSFLRWEKLVKQMASNRLLTNETKIEFFFVHRHEKTFPNFAKMTILC